MLLRSYKVFDVYELHATQATDSEFFNEINNLHVSRLFAGSPRGRRPRSFCYVWCKKKALKGPQ